MDLKGASAIHDFMDTYPSAKDVKHEVWELMLAAMGSDHADMWDKKQRADKLFL